MTRILHIIPALGQGGAENVLAKIVSRRSPTFEHHVVSLTAGDAYFPMPGAAIHALGLRRGQISPRAALSLRRLAERIRPDLVHAWLYHGNLASVTIQDLCPSIVWSIHNSSLSWLRSKPGTILVNRLCAALSHGLPKAVVYASASAREAHEAIGYSRRRGALIENGIDFSSFRFRAAARERIRSVLRAGDHKLIGCVARFDPQKDHRTLIRAFGRIVDRTPDARLVLIGEGCVSSNGTLMGWLHDEGVARHTMLLGARTDIPDLMCGLDALVLGSGYGEALPLVAIEAAAVGLPLVATSVGDVHPFVRHADHIVPPRNPVALAAVLARVLFEEQWARSEDESSPRRQVLEDRFGIGGMVRRYEALYRDEADRADAPRPAPESRHHAAPRPLDADLGVGA